MNRVRNLGHTNYNYEKALDTLLIPSHCPGRLLYVPGRADNIRRVFQNHVYPAKTYIMMHT